MEGSPNDWKNIIGISASVWTILQMFSPMPSCYNFIKKKSVGDMIVTPYAVALTSCSLWIVYGCIIGDKTIIRVNLIGCGLQFSYSLCFYYYSKKKNQVKKQIGLGFCTVTTAIIYSILETDIKRLVTLFGLLCSCVTVLFFASPLAQMNYVIKVWNSESLPRLLIATTFIVSVQWSLYGYIINNAYILVTNFLGATLSGIQLALIFIIPRESNSKIVFMI